MFVLVETREGPVLLQPEELRPTQVPAWRALLLAELAELNAEDDDSAEEPEDPPASLLAALNDVLATMPPLSSEGEPWTPKSLAEAVVSQAVKSGRLDQFAAATDEADR